MGDQNAAGKTKEVSANCGRPLVNMASRNER